MGATTSTELLALEAISIGDPSCSRDEAIRLVGERLVSRGHVDQAYVDAMLEREQTVSTFLGNGVAMPHGTFESKSAVHSTGIVVAQFPDGVDWGVGTAHLVIGLAAVGDDHVQVLSHIADVLQDEDLAEALWTTDDAAHMHSVLNAPAEEEDDDAVGGSITITSEAGLHARPASLIVELAKSFDGTILISKGDRQAKANSIMSVLSLGAVTNDTVDVSIDGDEEAGSAAFAEIERILTTSEQDL